jgi:hypothetical protein
MPFGEIDPSQNFGGLLDAITGKELWSSGDQIASFNHMSGLTVANGKLYLGA